jgi:hypothetical protein
MSICLLNKAGMIRNVSHMEHTKNTLDNQLPPFNSMRRGSMRASNDS